MPNRYFDRDYDRLRWEDERRRREAERRERYRNEDRYRDQNEGGSWFDSPRSDYWRDTPEYEDETERQRQWARTRERQGSPVEKPWLPENQGVQPGMGTFGGTNYGGVFGSSPWGGGAERYSITDPYANEWYVKQLEKGRHTGVGPAGYKRSDSRITEDVCDRLAYHPGIDAREIEVKVENGEVTLSGFAADRQTKRMAEDVAEHVFGVKDVHNYIRVSREPRDTEAA